MAASASELNLAGLNQYTTKEQATSISQFSDVKPTDWAYQALSTLVERYGCIAGYPNGTYKGSQAMTRWEAAALLNACLDRITEVTDELKRLTKEFEKELAVLKGRVDSLEAKVGQLDAMTFSTTTKLKGLATFVLGANNFSGTNSGGQYAGTEYTPAFNQANYGATVFNYDVRLNFDTSFTGKDLLRTVLRGGMPEVTTVRPIPPEPSQPWRRSTNSQPATTSLAFSSSFTTSPSEISSAHRSDRWCAPTTRGCSACGPAFTPRTPFSTSSPTPAPPGPTTPAPSVVVADSSTAPNGPKASPSARTTSPQKVAPTTTM